MPCQPGLGPRFTKMRAAPEAGRHWQQSDKRTRHRRAGGIKENQQSLTESHQPGERSESRSRLWYFSRASLGQMLTKSWPAWSTWKRPMSARWHQRMLRNGGPSSLKMKNTSWHDHRGHYWSSPARRTRLEGGEGGKRGREGRGERVDHKVVSFQFICFFGRDKEDLEISRSGNFVREACLTFGDHGPAQSY